MICKSKNGDFIYRCQFSSTMSTEGQWAKCDEFFNQFKQIIGQFGQLRECLLNGLWRLVQKYPTRYPSYRFATGSVLEELFSLVCRIVGKLDVYAVGIEPSSIGYDLVLGQNPYKETEYMPDENAPKISLKSSFSRYTDVIHLTNYLTNPAKGRTKTRQPVHPIIFVISEFGFVYVTPDKWPEIDSHIADGTAMKVKVKDIKKFGTRNPQYLARCNEIAHSPWDKITPLHYLSDAVEFVVSMGLTIPDDIRLRLDQKKERYCTPSRQTALDLFSNQNKRI